MHVTGTMGGPTAAKGAAPGRGWRIACGVLLILTGLLAIAMPMLAAVATAWFLGYMLLLVGVIEIVYAARSRPAPGFGWKLFSGIMTLLLGLIIVVMPVVGAATLALWFATLLFIGGFIRSALAFVVKPLAGWGWVLFDGLLSILLAILLVIGWPGSSIAIIGFITGFWLMVTGLWRLMLAGSATSAAA
ncbi:HdeD family acid-resistance protein [Luteibacter yeojuensis]